MPAELTTIRLHGPLGARFGSRHRLAVNSPREAIRALDVRTKGAFGAYLREHSEPGYCIRIGTHDQDLEGLSMRCTGKTVSIIPVVQGNKDGFDRVLAGIAIIVISYYTMGAGTAAWGGTAWGAGASAGYGIGMSCIMGGVSQLIAGTPQAPGPNDKESNRASYLFNGTVNTLAQGNPVPLLYGKLRVGGCVISGGTSTTKASGSVYSQRYIIGSSTQVKMNDGSYVAAGVLPIWGLRVLAWADGTLYDLAVDEIETGDTSQEVTITGTNGHITLGVQAALLGANGTTLMTPNVLRVGDELHGLGTITDIANVDSPQGTNVYLSDGGDLYPVPDAVKHASVLGLVTDSGAVVQCALVRSTCPHDYPDSN